MKILIYGFLGFLMVILIYLGILVGSAIKVALSVSKAHKNAIKERAKAQIIQESLKKEIE